MDKVIKKIGVGSLSLVLSIMGCLLIITFKNKVSYGDELLKFIGLKPWSNGIEGTHYTIFYALIIFIPSFVLGSKFKDDLGAKAGKMIALILIIIILFAFVGMPIVKK